MYIVHMYIEKLRCSIVRNIVERLFLHHFGVKNLFDKNHLFSDSFDDSAIRAWFLTEGFHCDDLLNIFSWKIF